MTNPIQGGPRPLELARELAQNTRSEVARPSSEGLSLPSVQAPEETGSTFGDLLAEFAQDVNSAQNTAETASTDFAEGRSDDIHGTMIKIQEADVKLRLLGNVRNRALEAYREIMRMGS
ncbi:MAG: flagellar hook-basal body complex protein FliE [Polyangiales bacterium]|jgi:flagellar hook-basal body complex protein FliE